MQPTVNHRAAVRHLAGQFVVLLLVAAVASGLAYAINPHRPRYDSYRPAEIDLADVPTHSVLWIDARSAAAYAKGHVPSAISLNEDVWENSLPAFVEVWRPGQTIVVYCDSAQCHASEAVARRLVREFNATNVSVLKGGWEAWKQSK